MFDNGDQNQIANPSVAELYEDALVHETGSAITSSGALTAYSGAKTGRSPLDKRIVREPTSEDDIWWGPVNKPMTPEVRLFLLFSFSRVFSLYFCAQNTCPILLCPFLHKPPPETRREKQGVIEVGEKNSPCHV